MPFHPTFDDDVVDLDPIRGFAGRAGRATSTSCIGNTRDELRLFADPAPRDLDDAGLMPTCSRRLGGRRRRPGRGPRRVPRRPPDRARRGRSGRRPAPTRCCASPRCGSPTRRRGRRPGPRSCTGSTGRRRASAPPTRSTCRSPSAPSTATAGARRWAPTTGAERWAGRSATRGARSRATGDPSHRGIGDWPAHDTATRPTLLFDHAVPARPTTPTARPAPCGWGEPGVPAGGSGGHEAEDALRLREHVELAVAVLAERRHASTCSTPRSRSVHVAALADLRGHDRAVAVVGVEVPATQRRDLCAAVHVPTGDRAVAVGVAVLDGASRRAVSAPSR